MNFVYHRKPPGMQGKILYPLNRLKSIYPDIYNEAIKKYTGRELLLELKLPYLDCLWNDVLHCSTIDLQIVFDGLYKTGRRISDPVWFKIPVSMLCKYPAIYFKNPDNHPEPYKIKGNYEIFDPERYSEMKALPESSTDYYKEMMSRGELPLVFKKLPHVLIMGAIDTEELETIHWNNSNVVK